MNMNFINLNPNILIWVGLLWVRFEVGEGGVKLLPSPQLSDTR